MTHSLAAQPYLKMNGLGNEITILDLRGTSLTVAPADARAIAGDAATTFDQLMVLFDPKTAGTDASLRIFNTDGSESSACGNGTRCVAWSLMEGTERKSLTLETGAGLIDCQRAGETLFTVDMGVPRFDWADIPLAIPQADTRAIDFSFTTPQGKVLSAPACVNMGNPHVIFWVEDVEAYDLATHGPVLEQDPLFPARANISLVHVSSRNSLVQKVWERGAGLTRACGSGACAAAVAAARQGLTGRKVRVSLPGGDLNIEWRLSDDHVLMTGPTEFEHRGLLAPALFAEMTDER